MFHEEFFPTPVHIIEKMLAPYRRTYRERMGFRNHNDITPLDDSNSWEMVYYKLSDKTILEPSAGKGDILDFLTNKEFKNHIDKKNFYCIESNPELQLILQGKSYRLIDNDFLQYKGEYFFDLIIMNPPFSNGDDHLLKAWDILEEGDIICLLNAETIKNPYSKKRQLIQKIIETNGSIEYIQDGFINAERETDVEAVIVRLNKKSTTKKFNFNFENVTKEEDLKIDDKILGDEIATRDVVSNMILQYNKLKETFIEFLKIKDGLQFYAQGLITSQYNTIDKIINAIMEDNFKGKTNTVKYNAFLNETKQEVWNTVIKQIGMERYMTSNVQKNFNQFTQNQGALDFTKENVQALISMLLENSGSILDQAVIDVFDMFTKYHKENRCHVEGWVSNDKFKVNKKVILPYVIECGYNGFYKANIYRSAYNDFKDIDKAMCYLTGKKYESIKQIERTIDEVKIRSTEKAESEFFFIRCYLKGTIHLFFKDEKLWQEFNMRACSGKNWLPEEEKKEVASI